MWSSIANIFTGGATKAISDIATEWIDTDKESAEAKAIMVKTLDPNGSMRRDLSRFASIAYGFYLFMTTVLLFMVAFDLGDAAGATKASEMMTELFLPITTAWGSIVGASFGVNGINSSKGK
jgi:hypothetical protein